MRPDKKKVIDEQWDDERVRSFLDKPPLGEGENPDYSAVLYAYRSMRAEDFGRFIDMFVAAGRDPLARGIAGETVLETIADHRRAEAFREILSAAAGRA